MPLPKEDPEKKKKDGELVPGLAKGYGTKGMYSGADRGALAGTLGPLKKTRISAMGPHGSKGMPKGESKGASAIQRAAQLRMQAKK